MQLLIFLTVTGLPSVRDSKVKKAAAAVRKGEHGTRCGLSWKEEKQAVVTERTNNDCYYCSSATSSSAPNAVFWGWTPLDATDNKVVIMCFPHLQPLNKYHSNYLQNTSDWAGLLLVFVEESLKGFHIICLVVSLWYSTWNHITDHLQISVKLHVDVKTALFVIIC